MPSLSVDKILDFVLIFGGATVVFLDVEVVVVELVEEVVVEVVESEVVLDSVFDVVIDFAGDGDKIVPRCDLDLSFDDDILMAESFSSYTPPMAAPKTCCYTKLRYMAIRNFYQLNFTP